MAGYGVVRYLTLLIVKSKIDAIFQGDVSKIHKEVSEFKGNYKKTVEEGLVKDLQELDKIKQVQLKLVNHNVQQKIEEMEEILKDTNKSRGGWGDLLKRSATLYQSNVFCLRLYIFFFPSSMFL